MKILLHQFKFCAIFISKPFCNRFQESGAKNVNEQEDGVLIFRGYDFRFMFRARLMRNGLCN
jgi:hypothetical protein